MPFFLLFRAFDGIIRLIGIGGESIKESQQLLHVGVEATKGAEAARAGELSRAGRFSRFLRPIARIPRLLKLESKEAKEEEKEYLKFFEEPIEIIENKFKKIKR